MLTKEYRIAMPISVDEYKMGQLYMISKHSLEQSEAGEGVEVIHNVPHNDSIHGDGQYTEKHIHLNSRLPYWLQSVTPRIFYVIEKSWNYYPYTETEYTCSFLPKFSIFIKTRYEDNHGSTDNCLGLNESELESREVDYVDIAYDELVPKHYKEEEDPKFFKSRKTGRGPLMDGWREVSSPVMCSYKFVQCSFEVWGLQTRVESYAQAAIRDILLLGHRQAFAWIDEWHGMTLEEIRDFEKSMQKTTNEKVLGPAQEEGEDTGKKGDGEAKDAEEEAEEAKEETAPSQANQGDAPPAASGGLRSWLGW